MAYTFKKHEKLCNHHTIEKLFAQGKYLKNAPLMMLYLPLDAQERTQVLVSVSKRYFKKAVDRNRIKRLLREAYRLQKNNIPQRPLAIALLYQSNKMGDFHAIYKALQSLIETLHTTINTNKNEQNIPLSDTNSTAQ